MIRQVLILMAVVATAVAIPCFAQSVTPLNLNPYYIESRCEFNAAMDSLGSAAHICTSQTTKEGCEVLKFCWWRDTTNQNVISQHTADEFTDQVIPLYTSPALDVYVYLTPFSSNVVLLVSGSNYMIVGTGGGTNEANYIKNKLASYIAGKSLVGAVMVNAYPQSIRGIGVWRKSYPYAPVYASSEFGEAIEELFFVETAMMARNERTYGTLLPWGVDGFLGIGSGKEDRAVPPQPWQYPTVLISTLTDIFLDGNQIQLIPTAELSGSLMVRLPGLPNILIVGNAGTYLPDAGSLVRTKSDVTRWCDNLDHMRSLAPNILVPAHGRPVVGPSNVLSAILAQRDSLRYIRDQTINKINQHMALEDIEATVVLPPNLANSLYARELTSRTASIVRAVYHHYMGWFDGNPASLYTMSSTDRARRLIALAGSESSALKYARQCISEHTRDGAQTALEVAGALRKVNPSSEATAIYVQALKMLAFTESSAHYRNYYLSEIQLVQTPQ